MIRLVVMAVVLLGMIVTTGCGGGGGSSSGGGSASATTRLMTFQGGEHWLYNVSGGVSGTVNVFTSVVTYDGGTYLAMNQTINSQSQNLTAIQLFLQDPTTSGLFLNYTNGAKLVTPQETVFGTYRIGKALTATIRTAADSSVMTTDIVASETVKVPAGTFRTWKVFRSETADDYSTSGNYWYAPETGNFVKAEYSTNFTAGAYAGQAYSYHVELQSTTTRAKAPRSDAEVVGSRPAIAGMTAGLR